VGNQNPRIYSGGGKAYHSFEGGLRAEKKNKKGKFRNIQAKVQFRTTGGLFGRLDYKGRSMNTHKKKIFCRWGGDQRKRSKGTIKRKHNPNSESNGRRDRKKKNGEPELDKRYL